MKNRLGRSGKKKSQKCSLEGSMRGVGSLAYQRLKTLVVMGWWAFRV